MAQLSPAAPAATDSLYCIFIKSSCPLYVLAGIFSKENAQREQCVTNVGILHKLADPVPLFMQELTQEGTLCSSIQYAHSRLSTEERERFGLWLEP
jgi:hypothetical protein